MKNDNSVAFPTNGKETFAERLEIAIGSTSVRAFANAIDISEGALRKYLKGVSLPQIDKAILMAKQANVSLDWLLTGEEALPVTDSGSNNAIAISEFNEEFVLIPGYHVAVSTGHGKLCPDEQIKRHLAFRSKWLKFRGFEADSLAVVFASGDSMEPTIHGNNTLLVNTADTKLTDGSIFVLRFGDELYAKRLQKRFDGDILLISDNKEYEDQVVKANEIEKLHIIGKVVWIGKDLY
ncbi:XRE family transcriptional regulator [Shewanella psychrotolerans]|uniref:XRE family transcriptional regulator n=1 Tax=Shewanella psychrotolerans TaxID=2864206 RepID=UPI001C66188F|nr:XRE family transcriptional regulator [Shewanella psychrotolerans]QYK02766.1 helix-turn-helix domain-containing protein [Shewanella psychrotolerans]